MGFDLVGPDLVFAGMASFLMAAGVISVKEGAAGFSNTGVLTVLVLFVVAEGVNQTGALDILFRYVLGGRGRDGRPANTQFAQMRLMVRVFECGLYSFCFLCPCFGHGSFFSFLFFCLSQPFLFCSRV